MVTGQLAHTDNSRPFARQDCRVTSRIAPDNIAK